MNLHPLTRPRLIAAGALAGGAVLANLAFTALGSAFEYPDVLLAPTADILRRFTDHQSQVMLWFAALAVSAALLAPGAVALGRLGTGRAARWSVWAGVGAAIVQVVGLSRWILLVPSLAAGAADPTASDAARQQAIAHFELAHNLLGKGIGETLGYTLTALWTVLVLVGFPELRGGRISTALGATSAFLIALGVFTPLGAPGTDLANFVGYILWSVWVLVLAVRLVRQHLAGVRSARATLAAPVPGMLAT